MEAPDAPAPTYIETMAACETMAIEILGFPDGRTRYPGGVVDALTFPPGLQNQPLDALLPWALMKKQTLSSFLALLKGPVAGQAPPILAAAAVSATPPLPTTTTTEPHPTTTAPLTTNTAPLSTTTAPLTTNTWPAEQYFTTRSSDLPYPRLPNALEKARPIRRKSEGDKPRTSAAFFWNCCHQEIVFKGRPLCNADLCTLFADRCKALSLPATRGHDKWLRKHPDLRGLLLLVLYKAAGVRVKVDDKNAMKVLEPAWRKRGEEILEQLAQWFRQGQAGRSGDALPSVVRLILSQIPDWPTQDDATDLQCFRRIIMSEHRFEEECTKVRGGNAADL